MKYLMQILCGGFLGTCLLGVLGGCENSLLDRSLVFSTHTTLGLEVSISPAETSAPARILMGYKRSEGVLNPVYHSDGAEPAEAGETGPKRYREKAYSVLAKIATDVSGKAGVGDRGSTEAAMALSQWFATGRAAELLAEQPGTPSALSGSAGSGASGEEAVRDRLIGPAGDQFVVLMGQIQGTLVREGGEAKRIALALDEVADNLRIPIEMVFYRKITKADPADAQKVYIENFNRTVLPALRNAQGFARVTQFHNNLDDSLVALRAMAVTLQGAGPFKIISWDGTTEMPMSAAEFQAILDQQIALSEESREMIATHESVQNLLRYFSEPYIPSSN